MAWGPDWGVFYRPVCCTGTYLSGTTIIEMWQPGNADETAKLVPALWQAAINGLAVDIDEELIMRIQGNIDQAFEQSSYLELL